MSSSASHLKVLTLSPCRLLRLHQALQLVQGVLAELKPESGVAALCGLLLSPLLWSGTASETHS